VSSVRLTEFSHGAGCACKLGPEELSQVLEPVRGHSASTHPDLLVGVSTSDDAGVFSLGNGTALVQTMDIFTPVVDGPADWGRIAAANALSDVYAMGGSPITALQYLAWPRGTLDFEIAGQVIEGGLEVMAKAGCTVVGGHSIDSPEPTYGFAITGTVPSDRYVSNAGAGPGDRLVLTKPLGVGIITTAIKRGTCPPDVAARAIESMTTLNELAGAALVTHGASGATDVTGFGLLGHLRELCLGSGVAATVEMGRVPVLPGARALLEAGMWAGGSQRNLESVSTFVRSSVAESELKLLADAQTSGGIMAALPVDRVEDYLAAVPGAVTIGHFSPGAGIIVTT
jgi:selenide,water dikinase